MVTYQADIVGGDSKHTGGEKHHLYLKAVLGVLGVNCRGIDESEEKGLYCSLMGWMAPDWNGWLCCLLNSPMSQKIGPHADEKSVCFSVYFDSAI